MDTRSIEKENNSFLVFKIKGVILHIRMNCFVLIFESMLVLLDICKENQQIKTIIIFNLTHGNTLNLKTVISVFL